MTGEVNNLPQTLQVQQQIVENDRQERVKAAEASRRLDLLRIAKEVVLENRRMKGVDAGDITSEEILAFTKELAEYVG